MGKLENDIKNILNLHVSLHENHKKLKAVRSNVRYAFDDETVKLLTQTFLDSGWQPPRYIAESEPRKPGDDN